ncbi:MAG: maleylpyruvate isomerase family mycothiol-dependent enzyme [Acidimicrobiales bacterium]
MTNQPNQTIENLKACWTSLDGLVGQLGHDQWSTQSLCPDWTVRGVIAHLGGIEYMFAQDEPGAWTQSLPFEKVGQWMSQVAELGDDDFLAAYRQVIDTRRAQVDTLGDEQLALPTLTPVGPGDYGRFLAVRVFDFWVHEQDIRVPLGIAGHDSGPAAEQAIDEIESSLGYIVGKKIGLPDGMSISIELTGPVERSMHVAVTGRATRVDSLDDPSVVLRTDSTTFALLACGRIDPQGPIDQGRIAWDGDAGWGETAARNLAFTM